MPKPFFFADTNFQKYRAVETEVGLVTPAQLVWMRNVLRTGAKQALTARESGESMHTRAARVAKAKQQDGFSNFPVAGPDKCHTTGSYTCMR